MAMTAEQIEAELRRKASLGIAPTNAANTGRYNQIKSSIQSQIQPKPQPSQQLQPKPQQQPFQLDPGQSYVRKALEDAGVTDIGYDKTRNIVTAGGFDVLQPDKVVRGSSIASGDALKKAIADIRERENQKKQQDLFSRLESMLGSAPQPKEFNYDAESDPVYQAALRRAGANAQTATGNAMAELNRRGLLNSTVTSDRAAQIQQGEFGRVSDEILPQLIQQAYGRYRDTYNDQYQQHRDQVGDVAGLFSTANQLGQQSFENQYTLGRAERADTESDRAYDRDVLESNRDFNYTSGRDKVADQQWESEFNRIKEQDGIQNALAWASQNLNESQERRISSNQSSGGSGGSSGGSSPSKESVITDINLPRTAASMETFIINNLPGGNNVAGPPSPNQLEQIEEMILSNPNLSDADRVKLYQRFGIPLG